MMRHRFLAAVVLISGVVAVSVARSDSWAQQLAPQSVALADRGQLWALIVGNDSYRGAALDNAIRDARAVHHTLEDLGFTARLVLDANERTLRSEIARFVSRIRPGDSAFFYYAGHGIQIAGENYLLPVDFTAANENAAKSRSYSASNLANALASTSADLVVVVLDACRNNPFRPGGSRESGRSIADAPGLAAMPAYGLRGGSSMRSAAGMLIQLATGSGRTADDGLFAGHLIAALREPGLRVEDVFSNVRQRVNEASKGRQVPLTMSSIVRPVYFIPPKPSACLDGRLWEMVKDATVPELLDLYLTNCPDGANVAEAERRLENRRIEQAAQRAAADVVEWEAARETKSHKLLGDIVERGGRFAADARAVLEAMPGEAHEESRAPDEGAVWEIVQAYGKAYSSYDLESMRKLFPSISAGQQSSVAGLRRSCRSYEVRFSNKTVYQNGDTAFVEVQAEYDCRPTTNQSNVIGRTRDVFRLRRATTGNWLIDSLGSLDR
jgi:hypothetical protein